jgi:hypothetical protein
VTQIQRQQDRKRSLLVQKEETDLLAETVRDLPPLAVRLLDVRVRVSDAVEAVMIEDGAKLVLQGIGE